MICFIWSHGCVIVSDLVGTDEKTKNMQTTLDPSQVILSLAFELIFHKYEDNVS